MENVQYEMRVKMRSKRDGASRHKKARAKLTREEKREIAQGMYREIEKNIRTILAGGIKLAVCGGLGMVAVSFLLRAPVSAELWAAGCAGCLAYRWLSRLVSIEPREKNKKAPR